jgi:hypothetical protein
VKLGTRLILQAFLLFEHPQPCSILHFAKAIFLFLLLSLFSYSEVFTKSDFKLGTEAISITQKVRKT